MLKGLIVNLTPTLIVCIHNFHTRRNSHPYTGYNKRDDRNLKENYNYILVHGRYLITIFFYLFMQFVRYQNLNIFEKHNSIIILS